MTGTTAPGVEPTTIRLAREADTEAIFAVRIAVRENVLTMTQLAELGVTPESFREGLRTAPATWVAEAAGRILGFGSVDVTDGSVFALFVHPDAEGRGAGRALLSAMEAELFARFPRIWLETDGASRAAGFYQRQGWTVVADREDGDVRMEKALG
ncbi:GNAT family N-acetyltransferase [Leucobacter sp. M11]|uniref:GNAT family N-acetyltransferase n=1 Tax=Leucobacter sp. M11 TaxID=2993565 RepID=UPI002D7FE371|nr:GNAT family N-acetyltransferase [Leucobacter sp. M11]MEB4613123.1 GNAT family N-acetyltransferase [Leucobacter sp. M11]